ncbi:MAG: hypothetical protein CBB71_17825 [Rhodopirellula sp. TMED11]|nr:MAG: hypothetical protein CBB71_17825 [Rhodopirellula sp. TMED11]
MRSKLAEPTVGETGAGKKTAFRIPLLIDSPRRDIGQGISMSLGEAVNKGNCQDSRRTPGLLESDSPGEVTR